MDRQTRLIIWNQLEILKHLNPAQDEDLTLSQSIVANGYTTRYNDVFHTISESEASEEMQEEVYDILNMFRALDTAKTRGWIPSSARNASFQGFDGNNDDHYSFAGHLIDDEGLYEESSPNKNSHSSATVDLYRRMLAKWETQNRKHDLTDEEAESIIAL